MNDESSFWSLTCFRCPFCLYTNQKPQLPVLQECEKYQKLHKHMDTLRLMSHWMYIILWPTLPQCDSWMLQPQKLTLKSPCKTSHVHSQHKSNISVPCSVCAFNFTSELMWQVTHEDFTGTHVVWISFITLFDMITCNFSFLVQFTN